jgi:hypothetical protein
MTVNRGSATTKPLTNEINPERMYGASDRMTFGHSAREVLRISSPTGPIRRSVGAAGAIALAAALTTAPQLGTVDPFRRAETSHTARATTRTSAAKSSTVSLAEARQMALQIAEKAEEERYAIAISDARFYAYDDDAGRED